MSKSVNQVFLLGNVGKEPEFKESTNGTAIAKFSVATNDREKLSDGQYKDRVEWHNVVAFKRTAEVIRDYVRMGDKIHVNGRIQTRTYEKNGETKYFTEIVANDITLLGAKASGVDKSEGTKSADDSDFPF